jgi:gliding motility-associated-like protein
MQYEWNFGDAQTSTAINPTHFYATAGNYVVALKATTANGCSHTYLTDDTVKIFRTTTASIIGDAEKCMQNILVYKPSIFTEDSITTYDWKVNSITSSTADSLRYNFTTAGNYTIVLNIQTAYGCNITTSKNVVIHPLPVPAAAPDTTICRGGSVILRSFDGVRYQWTASATLQDDTTATPTATPLFTTDYFVTVTNQFGCIQKDTVTVKVDEPVGLTVSSNDSICIGERIQLRANSTVSNYLWSPAAGLSSTTIASPFASPTVTTLYKVIAFSNNVCKTDSATILIGVGNIPTVNAGADINIAAGTPLQLSASVNSSDVTSYLWSPATGLDCSDCPNPSFTADNNITYKVTVETIYGCRASDEVRIVVFCGKGQLYIPNAFSPNNDGLNDRFYIKGYGIASIKRMLVFNRWGQTVFQKQNVPINEPSQGWDGTFNGQPPLTTAAYVYVLDVICKDGQEFSYKGTVMLVK